MRAPGTVRELMPGQPTEALNVLAAIPPLIWDGGGLVLAQLRELTGLDTSAIQNWVKRGYVAPPANKHYQKDQVARILIINALRESLRLEEIASMVAYVNGSLVDSSDDLIPDSELYALLCRAAVWIDSDNYIHIDEMRRRVEALCAGISCELAKTRTEAVLLSMCVCLQSITIKRRVEGMIEKMKGDMSDG